MPLDSRGPRYITADIRGATATLRAPLVYQGRSDPISVPIGFTTDFATVPRFLTWLIPTMGAYTLAAVVHDKLCEDLNIWRKNSWPVPAVNARDTDGIFRRICREEGTPLVRRWLLWTGVRWGALFNPARRAGWWRDAPAVLLISLVALPFLLLPALFVGLTLAVDRAVETFR